MCGSTSAGRGGRRAAGGAGDGALRPGRRAHPGGTQSLLGEGWDAPALNSLILASNTASFMLSNQMRGRAIRIDPANPAKVANIWHLATVEPPQGGAAAQAIEAVSWGHLMDDPAEGLSDMALLARRFRALEGVSKGESTLIESGVGRLAVDLAGDVGLADRRTLAEAADRPAIARRWATSLGDGAPRARVRETAAPNYAPRNLSSGDTLQALLWSALWSGVFAVGEEMVSVDAGVGVSLMALGGVLVLGSLPGLFRAARLAWRNGSLEGRLTQVGLVVLEALGAARLVSEDDARRGAFQVRRSLDGRNDIVLLGVSRGAGRLGMQAIAEVLGPVENPRYLLVRFSRLGFRTRTDYHATPSVLAAKKAWAQRFAALWHARIGDCRLVFTRTPEGRRTLLRARAKSFAAAFQRSVDRRSAWL